MVGVPPVSLFRAFSDDLLESFGYRFLGLKTVDMTSHKLSMSQLTPDSDEPEKGIKRQRKRPHLLRNGTLVSEISQDEFPPYPPSRTLPSLPTTLQDPEDFPFVLYHQIPVPPVS